MAVEDQMIVIVSPLIDYRAIHTTLEWIFIVRFSVGAVAGGLLCGLGFGWAPMLWDAGRDKPVQPAKAESPARNPANPVASTHASPRDSDAIPPAASRRGPAAILITPVSTVQNLKITNSTSIGAPMLVADGATIHGLEMTLNKVYGADEAVRLGDVFGADRQSPTGYPPAETRIEGNDPGRCV